MLTADLIAFVRAALPSAPARVLEVGAGDGELAALLTRAGYDVLAIDPVPAAEHVVPVALADVAEPDGSFDVAVAVLSLHHVEPLEPSLQRLAALVRPGGALVVDEFDVAGFDPAAATWWLEQQAAAGHDHATAPAQLVAEMQSKLHTVARLREALARDFALTEPEPVAYLHRWHLEPGLRDAEEWLITDGHIPPVGARFTGTRRDQPAPRALRGADGTLI
jgi:SAM-dependent methyltransferase